MAQTARDIMTKDPRIMKVGDTADDIAQVLAKENIGAVIICNDEQRLQGMVTDRDLAVEVLAQGKDAKSCKASDLVDGREVVTIGADDSIDLAIDTMKDHAVRRLPVIDGDKVIGILAQADIAKVANDQQVGRLVETISEAPDNTGRG
jgi:CBS domain-containing protein